MKKRSAGFKRYRSSKLNKDILILNSEDLIIDPSTGGSSTSMVTIRDVPGLNPSEHFISGPNNVRGCQLTKDQISFLKNSLKDYPLLIKEMDI